MKKFRKKYKNILWCFNILLIWYLLLISSLQLNTFTNAAFNDLLPVEWPIKTADIFHPNPDPVEERVDKSSLENVKGEEAVESCTSITASVRNKGSEDMLGTSIFYVYYDSINNPVNGNKVIGKLVFDNGVIPALKVGESTKLTFNLKDNQYLSGNYKFVFFQRDGHPGNNNGIFPNKNAAFFSEVIQVNNCPDPNVDKKLRNNPEPNNEINQSNADANKTAPDTNTNYLEQESSNRPVEENINLSGETNESQKGF